jgi:epoxide hydrolase-like predicted phosphatase
VCADAGCDNAVVAIRAVIFDIGGVLEVTPPTGWMERWAARLGVSGQEMSSRLEGTWRAGTLGEVDLDTVELRTMSALGLTDGELSEFMDDLWTEYMGSLNCELADYFGSLRPRYRTGILSNSFVGARERESAAYGFDQMCDAVVYSHEEGMAKPDPRFYGVILERLSVEAEEALFIDDSPACVQGALDVGMRAIRYFDNRQAIAEIEAQFAARPTAV